MQLLNRCFIAVLLLNVTFLLVIYAVFSSWNVDPDVVLVEEYGSCDPTVRSSRSPTATPRVILFWTTYFDYTDFAWGYGSKPFVTRGCSVRNCITTSDRRQLSRADAVVFHVRDLDPYDLPQIRYSCQRWIFFLMETPYNTFLNLRPFRNFFNWTMTYRFDSDIPPRIKLSEKNGTTISGQKRNYASGKTKVAVWLVSNCWSYSHRERYVEELRKYVDVDIFGSCGRSDDAICLKNSSLTDCYAAFEKRYKFYLSFENSLCVDYFSEKLYNVYEHDIIPVVLGKVQYEGFVPNHSLVDASQFATPKDLAEHLLKVDADDRLYNEYFEWKERYVFSVDSNPWCDACEKLNRGGEPSKTYEDIEKWWVEGSNCTNDFIGDWKVASWWDPYVDFLSVKFNSLKHHSKMLLNSLGSNSDKEGETD